MMFQLRMERCGRRVRRRLRGREGPFVRPSCKIHKLLAVWAWLRHHSPILDIPCYLGGVSGTYWTGCSCGRCWKAGHAPDRAGKAARQLASCRQAELPGKCADFEQLSRRAIPSSSGLVGSGSALWQANTTDYTSGKEGHDGGIGSTYSGWIKATQIWADSAQSVPDFELVGDATDFASMGGRQRGQGGWKLIRWASFLVWSGRLHCQDNTMPPPQMLLLSIVSLLQSRRNSSSQLRWPLSPVIAHDTFVETTGALNTVSTSLFKIANDI